MIIIVRVLQLFVEGTPLSGGSIALVCVTSVPRNVRFRGCPVIGRDIHPPHAE
jgi:hypothetical protein